MRESTRLHRDPHRTALLAGAALLVCGQRAYGADAPPAAGNAQDAQAQANNPLANFTAFNVHDFYIGELTDSDEDANQLWFRYARPFSIGDSRWLMRASLPVNTYPTGANASQQTGLGDLNAFAAWLIDTGVRNMSFGFGPQLTLPTATEATLVPSSGQPASSTRCSTTAGRSSRSATCSAGRRASPATWTIPRPSARSAT